MSPGLVVARTRPKSAVRLGRLDPLWAAACLGAAILIAVAYFQPWWHMDLTAPQYPKGLELVAWGTGIEGDLQELNELNHYVGVKMIDSDKIIEFRLFPYLIGAFVVALVAAAFLVHGRLRWLVIAALWGLPVGFAIDLQWYLYRFGHDLDPTAPFKFGTFTPKLIGGTQMVNFYSEGMVAAGFFLAVAAAALVSFGPWLARWLRAAWQNTGAARTPTAMMVLAVLLVAASAQPSGPATAASGSIASMIEKAVPGSTIVVPPGTYVGQVVIDKPLTLVGEGSPVIEGGGAGDVVRIAADGVSLRGFVIQGSAREVSEEPTGIRVEGHGSVIEDNRLQDVLYGITLREGGNHTVRGNTVTSITEFASDRRGHGIYLLATTGNVIRDNVVEHVKDGVFVIHSDGNTIGDNLISDARYGIHYMYSDNNSLTRNVVKDSAAGATIMYSRDVRLDGNELAANRSVGSGYGMLLKDVDNVEITGNLIHHNRLGIKMEGAPQSPLAFVTLGDNLIGYNEVGMELASNTDVTFTGNTFAGNLRQVVGSGATLEGRNRWSLDGRGNFWDDYQGYDRAGDGIGDLPYEYVSLYDDLIQREEAIKAYVFTPAQLALELASRWFPSYRPAPLVVDGSPLMSRTMTLGHEGSARSRVLTLAGSGALLLGAALMMLLAVGPRRRRWQAC